MGMAHPGAICGTGRGVCGRSAGCGAAALGHGSGIVGQQCCGAAAVPGC